MTTVPYGESYTITSHTQTITWHPYPAEKPTGMQRLFYVWRHEFDRGFNMTYHEGWYMDGRRYDDVEWWAEMPKPWEEDG